MKSKAAPTASPAYLRVMGIDPGLADTGWGVVQCGPDGSGASLVEYGVVQTPAGLPLALRLDAIFRQIGEVIERLEPGAVAIEELFFSKNAKTAMVVAHGRAASVLATARRSLPLAEYTPLQIKQALTGHGRAGKAQVQMMVRAVLGLEEVPRPDHAADALAAALCYIHTLARTRHMGTALMSAAGTSIPVQIENKSLLAQRRGRARRRR